MRKRRIALVSFLVLVLALSCVMFAVACTKTEKYTVAWNLDENVESVEALDGTKYEGTTEFEEGTKVSFTVTFKTGYEASAVKVGNKTLGATDGVYELTVSEDVTVTISSKPRLENITVELAKSDKVFYAGNVVNAEDIVVTGHYATGTTAALVGTIAYENGEAFALGDTKFSVSYPGVNTVDVTLGYSVKGLVTLNLDGGIFSDEAKAQLPAGYEINGDVVTWTFDSALAEDYELPEPTKLLDPNDESSALYLDRWSGLEDNKLAKGLAVSVTATAVYTNTLVEVASMTFVEKDGKAYLVIAGEFKAASSAYLYLYEGNDPPVEYGKQVYAVSADGKTFTLEFDLLEYIASTPVDPSTKEVMTDSSFLGKWMDIRFCAAYGDKVIQQELFVTDDTTYVDLGDEIVAQGEDGQFYRFFYETWTPAAGDGILGVPGAVFTGKESILKLHCEETDAYYVSGVTLEKRTVEGAEVAYMAISGMYLGDAGSEAALREIVEGIYADLQNNNDATNGGGWDVYINNGDQEVEVNYVANGTSTFKILFNLSILSNGDVAFSHIGSSSNNLTKSIPEVKLTIGTVTYILKNWTGWSSQLVCVFVEDASAPSIGYTGAELKVEDDKLLYVISGEYVNYTKAEIEALVVSYDLQINDNIAGGGWDRYSSFEAILTVNEDGTFTVTIDISALSDKYGYTTHIELGVEAKAEPADFKPDCDSYSQTVTFNGLSYKLVYVKGSSDGNQYWGCVGITVTDAGATVYTATSTELEVQDGKAVMVIKGTVENYQEGTQVYVATVLNGDPWTTTEQTAHVTISVDENGNFTATWDLAASGLATGSQYWIHFSAAGNDLPANTVNAEKVEVTVDGIKYTIVGLDAGANSPQIKLEAAV